MLRSASVLGRLALIALGASLVACTGLPTSPVVPKKGMVVHADGGGPVPCDETVVTDGTCVHGYIIPW